MQTPSTLRFSALFLLLFGLFATTSWGQTTIAEQDFDTGTSWNYESDVPFFDCNGGSDFLGIRDVSATILDFAPLNTNILSEQDLESPCGTSGEATISFPSLTTTTDISSYTNVTVSFDYDVEGYNANSDEAHYELFYDGVGQGRVVLQTGSTPGDDSEGSVSVNVPGTVNDIRLEIIIENNGGSGHSGFDNFLLEGTSSSGPTVGWDNTTSTENETNSPQTILIPVTLSNYSQNVDLDVAVTGGTAEAGDYTLNTNTLSFTGNGTQNVSIDINDDADTDDETIEITLTESTSTGIAISPDVHTITVLDDDTPPPAAITPGGYTEDFSGFDGSGFSPNPGAGQLHSDNWRVTGLGGPMNFGDTQTGGDFARGGSSGGVGTGGVYAFEVATGDDALGIQPGGSDFTPGEFTLQLENQTGGPITDLSISYDIYVYNDQNRANSFNFAHSDDDVTYTQESSLDYTSVEAEAGSPAWVLVSRSINLTGLSIPDGDFYYFQWQGNDDTGSGSRDEFALDNVSISSGSNPTLTASPSSISNLDYVENAGPSAEQSFTLTGTSLDNSNVTISAPTNFEIAEMSGGTYGSSITLNAYDGSATDIFVRMQASLMPGTYTGDIDITGGGASAITVSLDGEVTPAPTPSLTTNINAVSGLDYEETQGPSARKVFTLSGSNLDGTDVTITPPANFELSTTPPSGFTTSPIILESYDGADTAIDIRLVSALAVGTYSGDVTISGGGTPSDISVSLDGEVIDEVELNCDDIMTTAVIHCWDFNDGFRNGEDFSGAEPDQWSSPVSILARVTGNGRITHNFIEDEVAGFSGDSGNACSGSSAGQSFCPQGKTDEFPPNGNNGNFFILEFPTTCYGDLQLSFDARKSGNGFNSNTLEYSSDGGATWTEHSSSPFTPANNSWSTQTFSFSGITAVEDNPDFQVRITLDGGTTNLSNNRYDNINLESSQFLPVEWLSFTASQVAEQELVQLDWSVAWEEFHDYYEVQHSTDGIAWEALGRVQEDGEEILGRSPQKDYRFFHEFPQEGLNLYRIQQVDIDGAIDYSTIERVLFRGKQEDFRFAPNPTRDRLFFSWPSDRREQPVEMELISMQGQVFPLYRGLPPSQVRLTDMTAGMYLLVVRDESGTVVRRERVVVQ